ncbi:hypothetical protein PFDG_05303 [Plasmodium falciparum Dd2]|uniref:Uncharacterized protein n=1 Tax=Plasmodium falciparum (isolate Dd2) TaxID=57267 RepID=A0A0L7MAY3_PLAF4|nr:hypothetical protein PFDG_05303 [Plasmodium falciparum Dd2]
MQDINRKIKNYIKKYPDIHFYIDYDSNENEKENCMNGMERNHLYNEDYYMNHTYEEIKKYKSIGYNQGFFSKTPPPAGLEQPLHFNLRWRITT